MNEKIDFSLVLPVYNQADGIQSVLDDITRVLAATHFRFELLCVENGSRDTTLAVLKEYAARDPRVRMLTAPKGYGSAIITGLAASRGDLVGYMFSHGSCDAGILPQLLRHIAAGKADLAMTWRNERESLWRYTLSRIYNLTASLLFGLRLRDMNSTPKIFYRSALPLLRLSYRDSFIDVEFLCKARALGWRIHEFPMAYHRRSSGKSSTDWKTILQFLRNMLRYRFGREFRAWRASLRSKDGV